jgi:hypothetical protein
MAIDINSIDLDFYEAIVCEIKVRLNLESRIEFWIIPYFRLFIVNRMPELREVLGSYDNHK